MPDIEYFEYEGGIKDPTPRTIHVSQAMLDAWTDHDLRCLCDPDEACSCDD